MTHEFKHQLGSLGDIPMCQHHITLAAIGKSFTRQSANTDILNPRDTVQ
ncbi:MAG: hypothetical protein WC100_14880 [Sterolibacterium sp.]